MSITTKKSKGIDYLYFQAGVGKTLYLGPKNDLTKVKSENVLKALDYIKVRNSDYSALEESLVLMLSQEIRDQYLTKRIPEFQKLVDRYVSFLSVSAKQQYLSRGQQKAVEPTRRRRLDLLQKKFLSNHLCYTIFCTLWVWYLHQKLQELPTVFIEAKRLLEISKMQEREIKKSTDLMIYFEILKPQEDYRRPGFFYTLKSNDLFNHITNRLLEKFARDDKEQSLIALYEFASGLINDERLEKQYEEKLEKLLLPNEIELIFTPLSDYIREGYKKFRYVNKTIDSSSNKVTKSD